MKIVQINSVPNGSTGNIMMNIHKKLQEQGNESYVVWGRGRKSKNKNEIYLNDKLGVYIHCLYTRITGKTGFASKKATKKLIKKLIQINPDIIHFHNLHGYYINLEMLFNYTKNNNIKVIWTLHDCWPFTGQCAHFTSIKCEKWKDICYNCPKIKNYPKTIKDNSKWNFIKKKELFNNLNMTIVTPSKWLANIVKQSFLKNYTIEVINNGIDKNIFKHTSSEFRKKNNLENKKIILGVASVWGTGKGLDKFIELSKIIDENYKIVLVGLNKKQIKKLPNNIIGITRTYNQQELAGLYSTADIFFNASKEESFGLTTIEALSCKTPVLVYNSTALPEIVNGYKDYIIKDTKITSIFKQIKNIVSDNKTVNFKNEYNLEKMIDTYIDLYKKITNNNK